MQSIKLFFSTSFFFCIIAAFTSCNGQKDLMNMGQPISVLGKNIACIFQDKNNNYWFGSNGNGVYLYNGKTMRQITIKDGLCSNFVWEIQEDINGNLWFTTQDGFCSFDGENFTNHTDAIKNAPYTALKYQKGGIFFNHQNGICFYDGKSFANFTLYPSGYKPDKNNQYNPYGAYCILADTNGNVWFGTEKGVCVFDGKSFSFITDKDLEGPAVRSIFEDHSGTLWFGNNGGGLYRFDNKTLRNITEEKNLGNFEFLRKHEPIGKPGSMARVFAINEDKDKNLWIGTVDAGIWKFDGTSMVNYTSKDGLAGNSVTTIYKDRKGALWFIANQDVVYRFNGNSFSKFSLSQK
ncbi:MAG: two-component regulator propeller domain-containing protein [Flavobacterium sp.]